jgi:hypothetical protein
MRIAVVRVKVDPPGRLTLEQLSQGMTALVKIAEEAGIEVVDNDAPVRPSGRREVQLLIAGSDPDQLEQAGIELCAKAFGTDPVAGVVTYVSRGTDDDALGVLAGFGLTGEIRRSRNVDGFDVVYVALREADLARIGESRIHTALEASLNSEVHIVTE